MDKLEIELTIQETYFLLDNDYVIFCRDGKKYLYVYMADTDDYMLAEVVNGAWSVETKEAK